jgi:hypothetical protein
MGCKYFTFDQGNLLLMAGRKAQGLQENLKNAGLPKWHLLNVSLAARFFIEGTGDFSASSGCSSYYLS